MSNNIVDPPITWLLPSGVQTALKSLAYQVVVHRFSFSNSSRAEMGAKNLRLCLPKFNITNLTSHSNIIIKLLEKKRRKTDQGLVEHLAAVNDDG
jgi:hypothetical protein